MTINLNFSTVEGLEIGREKRVSKVMEAIENRKKLKKELEERSRNLRAQANILRHSNPAKACMLEHRGIVLADEAYRLKCENEKSMTGEQIRRSAINAWFALERDKAKR